MKRLFILLFVFVVSLLMVTGIPILAQADTPILGTLNLYDRGGGLIYDADLNITWLQEPNNTRMTWDQAMSWTQNLSVNVNGGSVKGWRLPTIAAGPYTWGYDGTTTAGYNITTSEMGHLFYTELCNIGLYDTNGKLGAFKDYLVNKGPFADLQPDYYWSNSINSGSSYEAYIFYFLEGSQMVKNVVGPYFAMAVHDGDVTVPEPTTLLLLGLGLMGLAGVRRQIK